MTTNGTGSGTSQSEISLTNRRFFEGAYAARIKFSDTPVSGGHVRYSVDGKLIADHSGKYYPRQNMSIDFNQWIIDLDAHQGSGTSTWHEQVDYVYRNKESVLTRAPTGPNRPPPFPPAGSPLPPGADRRIRQSAEVRLVARVRRPHSHYYVGTPQLWGATMAIKQSPLRLRSSIAAQEQQFLMFVLDELAAAYESRYDDVIRMTLGKSELPPAPEIVEAMLAAAADYSSSSLVFPAGLPALRERLAELYATEHGVQVSPSRIIVGVGSSSLLRNITQLLAEPGDEIVLPLPYYPLYVYCARLAGAEPRYYRVDPATSEIDMDSLASAMSERTRMVVVNSPGNPLGNVISAERLHEIDRIIAGRAVLVSDEIYLNVHFDDLGYSATEYADTLDSPLVVINSFSKAHRMYARRVGWTVVPDELARALTVVQHHTLLTTDPVPQYGAIAALDRAEGLSTLRSLYRSRRDVALERFAGVPGVRAVPSRGGFYLTLDCADFVRERGIPDTLDLAVRLLKATHVAAVPGSDFGLERMLRLSFTSHRFEEGVDRMTEFFGDRRPVSRSGQ